tara:strand:+ start:3353 stop:5020 length:1668 start_codon:yes stop_codon:yes gene_type:complete
VNVSKRIQLLPEHIIDQIKAGEVIERPSSLIKEILENSLDAGASSINLNIVENGLSLISIEDNGKGIASEDLPLAFCRHATSKISRFEDVYRLHSFGFRGEALASIASISKLTCESSHQKNKSVIKIEGGETKSHTHLGEQESSGTKIYIKDLFYNTPVRMKFIQSSKAEKNQIQKIIKSFLLANPKVEFKISWDNLDKEIYPAHTHSNAQDNFLARLSDVLNFKREDLVWSENVYDGIQCKVVLSKHSNRGNAHKNHFLFINNRYVQDIQLHKIVLNSAKSLWPEGETGHYVVYLNLPSDEIDVNVHPSKTKIKFFTPPKVFSMVSGTINHLMATQIQPQKESGLQNTSNQDSLLETQREVNYRNFEFNSDNKMQSYFENLHGQEQTQLTSAIESEINLPSFLLFKRNDQSYCLHKQKFYSYHLAFILNQKSINEETIPLMVSRPIKITGKNAKHNEEFLSQLGFEIDFIAEDSALLRTFPKQIQHYPYLAFIAEQLNKKKINGFNDLSFAFLEDFEMGQHLLMECLKQFSLTELLDEKIIVQLTDRNLSQLYE